MHFQRAAPCLLSSFLGPRVCNALLTLCFVQTPSIGCVGVGAHCYGLAVLRRMRVYYSSCVDAAGSTH